MRNFLLMATGVDVSKVLHDITTTPGIWNRSDVRRAPHGQNRDVDDILLRFQEGGATYEDIIGAGKLVNYPAFTEMPSIRPIVFGIMRQVEGLDLGRVIITRLPPGKTIPAHTDEYGVYVKGRKRYQVVVQCLPGVVFRCGDEQVQMKTGEVWWFNPMLEHEIVNNSADDRIVLIVDVTPCP